MKEERIGRVFIANQLWYVEDRGQYYSVTDQLPFHPVLKRGKHENARVAFYLKKHRAVVTGVID